MKIRTGFVSNSSSASFIIRFSSSLPIEEIKKYLDFSYKNFKPTSQHSYSFKVETKSVFNDWMDIDGWEFIRALSERRLKKFKLEKIIKIEDQWSECYEEMEFDSIPYYTNKIPTVEAKYVDYLIKRTDQISNQELKTFLAKKQ